MEIRDIPTAVCRNFWTLMIAVYLILVHTEYAICGELRMGGGPTNREGRVEVAYENNIQPGMWASVCGDGWTNINAMVACNEAGFPGPAVAVRHAKERYGESYLSVLLTNVDCEPDAPDLMHCSNSTSNIRPCSSEREAGAICQLPGYKGCYKMATVSIKSDINMIDKNLTVDSCLAFCINESMSLAGVSIDHCHCWLNMPNTTTEMTLVGHEHCLWHCPGNYLQLCGGTKRLLKTFAIYDTQEGFCGDPGGIAHGSRDNDWFQFGASVTYKCDEDYQMLGTKTLTCVQSGPGYDWNDASPICVPVPTTTVASTTEEASMGGEQKLEALSVGMVVGGVSLLFLIVFIAFTIACCKTRKKKPKKLIEEGEDGEQMGELKRSKKKKRSRKNKSKKVKKKHKEVDEDEKERDEMELEFATDDDENDKKDDDDKSEEEEDIVASENKANSKLDVGPIAVADHSYYQMDADQSSRGKNKPLPSARGQGRPMSSSKPAKFNFIETDDRKNSKRGRAGAQKNVFFLRGKGNDSASDILLRD
ncbi:uncharacterized protein [Diadema setosum]|uniref:uncharacterized protein n=1 Tax=Diadema setosum TaxID=31175 RepID=UPI003B3B82C3